MGSWWESFSWVHEAGPEVVYVVNIHVMQLPPSTVLTAETNAHATYNFLYQMSFVFFKWVPLAYSVQC